MLLMLAIHYGEAGEIFPRKPQVPRPKRRNGSEFPTVNAKLRKPLRSEQPSPRL